MKHKFILDFFLFDGEGGGEAGATASSSASTQETQKPQIVYGKSEGNDQTPSQVGSDKGSDVAAEWEALTGKNGKFHDLLGQRVSAAIQDRFKNQADFQGQVSQYNDALAPLFMNYGLKSGDIEGLSNAIANDEAFYRVGAEKAGLDIDQYKENLKLKAEAERGRQITEAFEEQQRRQALFGQWESDAAELQQIYPHFDLGLEIDSNPDFANLLNNGIDVRTAYISTHLNDVMAGANAYAERTATQNVVNAINNRAARPMESALNHSPAIERRSDPSKLTDADLDEINRIVEEGGTVAF